MLNHNSKKDRVILFEKYDYVFFSGIITAILQIVALILSIIKDLRSAKKFIGFVYSLDNCHLGTALFFMREPKE